MNRKLELLNIEQIIFIFNNKFVILIKFCKIKKIISYFLLFNLFLVQETKKILYYINLICY